MRREKCGFGGIGGGDKCGSIGYRRRKKCLVMNLHPPFYAEKDRDDGINGEKEKKFAGYGQKMSNAPCKCEKKFV